MKKAVYAVAILLIVGLVAVLVRDVFEHRNQVYLIADLALHVAEGRRLPTEEEMVVISEARAFIAYAFDHDLAELENILVLIGSLSEFETEDLHTRGAAIYARGRGTFLPIPLSPPYVRIIILDHELYDNGGRDYLFYTAFHEYTHAMRRILGIGREDRLLEEVETLITKIIIDLFLGLPLDLMHFIVNNPYVEATYYVIENIFSFIDDGEFQSGDLLHYLGLRRLLAIHYSEN